MTREFAHLHLHSEFSLQDSSLRLKPLIQEVRQRGMSAVAVTDLSNLFALVKFYKQALAGGIKPIFGADVWIHHGDREDRLSRLVLLCMDDQGYLNLKRLLSQSYQDGQRADRPTIDINWLRESAAGLIALSAGLEGDIGCAIQLQNSVLAEDCLQQWQAIFGDRFFLELQRTGRPYESTYISRALVYSRRFGVPLVATNDVRFINPEEFDAHEVRVCICSGVTLNDPRRPKRYSPQQYLRSRDEMLELFRDLPEAIDNSANIFRACNVRLHLGESFLPDFPVPASHSIDSFLRQVSAEGLEQRLDLLQQRTPATFDLDRKRYHARLELELGVIIQMGFAGYFLIVMDFINWARRQAIRVGPGRGSGAGSLVAYALKITDLDPIEYDLLFERFLNPERVSMPDFDVDFCMERRDEVIDYVADHYGRDQVSQIITYGTMAAKAVIRDVGRVMSYPYGFVDRIAKLIPFEIGITLEKALDREAPLLELYQQDEEVSRLIDMAISLEGLTRNVGKHAGGVVISPSHLTDFTPLYCEPGGAGLVSQFDHHDIDAIGLVKFDFLGLRTLTIIDWTVAAVNAKNTAAELEIEQIPIDDADVFKLLQAYHTTAVFQLESRGMKDLIRRLRPDSFEEIIALVALYRPGPLQSGMVDDFINRKHGSRIEYPHPALESILKPTYGIILYQEQVMQIAQVLAGYTLGAADLLRRAMGKKKPEEMQQQRAVFMKGAIANQVDSQTAAAIFDLMEKFAGYGFNKSHSAAYALVSYQTAWLKAHHPAEFMAAVLSSEMDNTDKIVPLIEECRRMGLTVMPPDINQSQYRFVAAGEGRVLYGLGAIKGVGRGVIERMITSRDAGEYVSLDDFCERGDSMRLNRKLLESLIKAGALDCFSKNRAALMSHLDYALQAAEQRQNNQDAGMVDLFAETEQQAAVRALPDCEPWDEKHRLMQEKEALGLYLTGHPIEMVEDEVRKITTASLSDWLDRLETAVHAADGHYRQKGQQTRVCGLVVDIRMKNNFNGREAFVTLDDRSGRLDVRVPADLLATIDPLLEKDLIWVVEGVIAYDDFNNGIKLRASSVVLLDNYRLQNARALHLFLDSEDLGTVDRLIRDLSPFKTPSALPMVIHMHRGDYAYELKTTGQWSLLASEQCLLTLGKYLQSKQFHVEY